MAANDHKFCQAYAAYIWWADEWMFHGSLESLPDTLNVPIHFDQVDGRVKVQDIKFELVERDGCIAYYRVKEND